MATSSATITFADGNTGTTYGFVADPSGNGRCRLFNTAYPTQLSGVIDGFGSFASVHYFRLFVPGSSGYKESPVYCTATALLTLQCTAVDSDGVAADQPVLVLSGGLLATEQNGPGDTFTLVPV